MRSDEPGAAGDEDSFRHGGGLSCWWINDLIPYLPAPAAPKHKVCQMTTFGLMSEKKKALRAVVRGRVQGVGFRQATMAKAPQTGAFGWVRNGEDDSVAAHLEGQEDAVDQ